MSENAQIIRKNTTSSPILPNLLDYQKTYSNFTWEDAENEVEYFADGKFNAAYNLVDRHAKSDKKDKIALLYKNANGERKQITYEELAGQSNQFANVLVSNGIEKGDRVFIFLPSIIERYVAFLGILKTGAIVGTLFSAFEELALLDRLSDSNAKMVITSPTLYPRIKKIWHELPHLQQVIIVSNNNEPFLEDERIVSYMLAMQDADAGFEPVHLQPTDYAYMLYTSGTTGKPKGVVHAHGDIVQAMATTKYALDVTDDDIYWCTADLGWVTGVVYGVLGIFGLGGTSVIYDGRFSPDAWYKVIEDCKVTVWYTAPTAIRMLMGAVVDVKQFDLSSLRHLASVGEPLNPEAIWWALKTYGLPFHDTWWQTETGSIAISNYPVLDIKPGSMGKPFPGVTAAIVDANGNELPAEQEGNLVLKPDSVYSLMKTIWHNGDKFNSYFTNGWYISGDRAYKDEDGYFWFVGRADDVINTSGERIGPFEVESALVEHPDVIEAGVIGKPDELRGEIIKAFVVVRPEAEPNEELKKNIAAFVKGKLSGHAYPREIEFIEKLPKTRSGKIMRRLLKARELGLPEGDTSTLEEY